MIEPSDDVLSAYVDGEVEPLVAAEIDNALKTNTALAARLEALRGTDKLLREAFAETLAAKPFELAKAEVANTGTAKPEAEKAQVAKTEAKAEAGKSDAPKVEPEKPEPAKAEPKPEPAKSEPIIGSPAIVERIEAPKSETPKSDAPRRADASTVVPFRPRPAAKMSLPVWSALAACFVLMLAGGTGGYFWRDSETSPPFVVAADGSMAASPELASAISRAHGGVAERIEGATMTVVLSFKAGSGHPCRQFNVANTESGVSAIACHHGSNWRIAGMVSHGGRNAPFQTAAGPDEALSNLADSLGFSEPMDAPAETRAIANGWK